MTPQEQDMIQGLIDRVQKTQLPDKDPAAENLIQGSLGRNPDALYILAQTVLVQKFALEQAQQQIAQAQQQITALKSQADQAQQQPRHATSFLGSLLGHNDPPPPPPPPLSGQQVGGPQYAPVQGYAPQPGSPQYGAPQYGAPQYGAAPAAPQGGGFLRSALQTATGVAAGALAFQGIESLMHGFGGGGGFGGGQQGFGGFGEGSPREEVINNYYGDSGQDRSGSGLSSDIEDRRGDSGDSSSQFADSNSGNDDSSSNFSGDDSSDSGSIFDSGGDSGNDSSFDSGGDSGGGDDSSFS